MWPSQPGQAAQPPRARDRDCGPPARLPGNAGGEEGREADRHLLCCSYALGGLAPLSTAGAGSVLLDARLDPILLTTDVAPTSDTVTQTRADDLRAAMGAARRRHSDRPVLRGANRTEIRVGVRIADQRGRLQRMHRAFVRRRRRIVALRIIWQIKPGAVIIVLLNRRLLGARGFCLDVRDPSIGAGRR